MIKKTQKSATVFISDLHLHPEDSAIQGRFNAFIDWLPTCANTLYILGDFLHAWPGDDALDNWSRGIAAKIADLKAKGIKVYYMHGNRDFLIGKAFHALTGWEVLKEPSVIYCGETQVLLAHGDGYCTADKSHQRFRRLTRNHLFCAIFKHIPLKIRMRIVGAVRMRNPIKSQEQMDVVEEAFIADMQAHNLSYLIHGHTHKQQLHEYRIDGKLLKRYVLSDWDDKPVILCYDGSSGFYFEQFQGCAGDL